MHRLLIVYLAIAFIGGAVGTAATFTVSTNEDIGPGSLRQAILDANANPGDHNLVNNASVEHTKYGEVRVGFQMVAEPNPVIAGQPVTFTITLTNYGMDAAPLLNLTLWTGWDATDFLITQTPDIQPEFQMETWLEFSWTNFPPLTAQSFRIIGVPLNSDLLTAQATLYTEFNRYLNSNYEWTNLTVAVEASEGILRFSPADYQLHKNNNDPIPVTVIRTGGSYGEVTVNYSTHDLSAIAGRDYLATNGQLRFGTGETEKNILVQALTNAPDGCNRLFALSLSNPGGGAVLWGRSNALVSLIQGNLAATGIVEIVRSDLMQAEGFSRSASNPRLSADGRYVLFVRFIWEMWPDSTFDYFVHDLKTGTSQQVDIPVSTQPQQPTDSGFSSSSLSSDGRFLAFSSSKNNLVTNDFNEHTDIFVRDLTAQVTYLASVNDANEASGIDGWSDIRISQNGNIVLFTSTKADLVTVSNWNEAQQIYARDFLNEKTTLVSISEDGQSSGNGLSSIGGVSADGRYIVFTSEASNLVANDTNGYSDVFVRDLHEDKTILVSGNQNGAGNGASRQAVMNGDGRFVAFVSEATDLVPGTTTSGSHIYIRDLVSNITHQVSVNAVGTSHCDQFLHPTISADGRFIAFQRTTPCTPSLVSTQSVSDIFLSDWVAGTTLLVSANCEGATPANGPSDYPNISADGRFIIFESYATDLVSGEFTPGDQNLYRWDRLTGQTILLTPNRAGTGGSRSTKYLGGISDDGNVVTFQCSGSDLVFADPAATWNEIYVWRAGNDIPQLSSARIAEDRILFTWPVGYALETTDSLAPDSPWWPVDDWLSEDVENPGRFMWKIIPSEANRFFRLRRR